MKKYTLNTEDVSRKGDVSLKILSEGIEFANVVSILDGHDSNKVMGKWTDFEITNDNHLLATPIWDMEDEDVVKKVVKIEKGFIGGLSVGIKPLKYFKDNEGVIIVEKSLLMEGSVTPVPANSNATITDVEPVITLSIVNDEFYDNFLLSVYHNNEQKVIADKVKEAENKPVVVEPIVEPEVIVEDTTVEPVVEPIVEEVPVEEVEIVEEVKEVKKAKKKDISDAKLSDDTLNLNDTILTLQQEMKDKEVFYLSQIDALKNELVILKQEEQNKEVMTYFNNAIKQGKITEGQKEAFVKLAQTDFETTKLLIEGLKINKQPMENLSGKIELSNDTKNFEWYQKNDSKYLMDLKINNIEEYNKLLNNMLSKK